MQFKKNQIIKLRIDDMGSKSEGIGHIDGYSFFLKGAIKGEYVEAIVTKVNKNYGYAKPINIIKKSEYRIEPKCNFYKKCGGCNMQHISYDGQVRFKYERVLNTINRIGGISTNDLKKAIANNGLESGILKSNKIFRYRNKAQYPVGKNDENKPIYGFYENRSHKIVAIDDCLLEPEINSLINDYIMSYVKINNISIYDEINHKGLLRHIMIRHGSCDNSILISLVINEYNYEKTVFYKDLENFVIGIKDTINSYKKDSYVLKSLSLNINTKKTNLIMGEEIVLLYGEEMIYDEMNSVKYAISPLSFYQVNHSQAELIYKITGDFADIKNTDIVFDIYCGTGTIGLYLAKKAMKVYSIEIMNEAIKMAEHNKIVNNIDNIEFFVGSAEKITYDLINEKSLTPDVVIVDPPRKGLFPELIDTIKNIAPSKIVYVSCDVATLARDLRLFLNTNEYELTKLVAVDQFCQTEHVESVVLMSRVAPTK